MKRTHIAAAVLLGLAALACAYLLSPFSKRRAALEVSVLAVEAAPGVIGYRAIIENHSVLPVFVTRCEFVDDTATRNVVVGDSLEVFESEGWKQAVERNRCSEIPNSAVHSALLWPTQRLHTAQFFPNVGFGSSPFQRGQQVRFVVFPSGERDTRIASSAFVVQ